jgi:hypothetical protein
MSSIIGFLERMGGDSQLRHAAGEELARALDEAQIEPLLAGAVLTGDPAKLQSMLQVERTLCCLVYRPDEEEKKEAEEEEEEPENGDDDESEKEGVPDDVPRP